MIVKHKIRYITYFSLCCLFPPQLSEFYYNCFFNRYGKQWSISPCPHYYMILHTFVIHSSITEKRNHTLSSCIREFQLGSYLFTQRNGGKISQQLKLHCYSWHRWGSLTFVAINGIILFKYTSPYEADWCRIPDVLHCQDVVYFSFSIVYFQKKSLRLIVLLRTPDMWKTKRSSSHFGKPCNQRVKVAL